MEIPSKCLFILITLFFSNSIYAGVGQTCSGFFHTYEVPAKTIQLETQTQNGKPRYYSVRNYSHYKGGELDKYLHSIKNLTQFSEKLEDVSTFIPDRTTIPSEAFFVANEIIPHIEDFLNAHEVKFRIETYEKPDDTKIRRSLIIVSEEGTSHLNELASDLAKYNRTLLVIDPIELFYGYSHYNQSQGKFFDIDAYTPGYAVSFYLLLHSSRKDFNFEISRTDSELSNWKLENMIEGMRNAGPDSLESIAAQQSREDSFKESRKKAEERLNKIIAKAKNKKGRSK